MSRGSTKNIATKSAGVRLYYRSVIIALSTTEAEYIALSTALREVIGVMNLLNELKGRGFVLTRQRLSYVARYLRTTSRASKLPLTIALGRAPNSYPFAYTTLGPILWRKLSPFNMCPHTSKRRIRLQNLCLAINSLN